MPRRGRSCFGAVFAAVVLGAAGRAEATTSTPLAGGGGFQGTIALPGEEDVWVVHALEGAALSFSVKGKGGLKPGLELLGPAGCGTIDVSPFASGLGTAAPKLTKLPLPATGAYAVRVTGLGGGVGSYTGKATVALAKAQKSISHPVTLSSAGAALIDFAAIAGSTLTVTISTSKVAALPRPARLISPGSSLDLAPFVKVSKKSVTAKGVPIPATGTHRLVVENDGPSGDVLVKLSLKTPKAKKKTKEVGGSLPITGLPLAGTLFPFDEVSFEVAADGLSAVRVEGLTTVKGVSNGAVFLVAHVPLAPGSNVLRVVASATDGSQIEDEVVVLRAEEAASAVLVSVAPTIAHTTPFSPSFEVALSPLASPGEALLLDADGDGVVDRTLVFPLAPFSQEYVVPGSVRPSLFVRTCDGVLLSAPPRTVPRIQVLPPPVEATADAFGASGMKGVDAARHAASSELFVLSPSQGAVYRFDAAGGLLQTVAIPGAGQQEGIGLSDSGDLYGVDTQNGRLYRLKRAAGYVLDLAFGVNGFAGVDVPLGLSSPSDVAVTTIAATGEERVLVADPGHARVVVLDAHGAFVEVLDGGGAFVDPRSLVARAGGGAVVADRGTGRLEWLAADGSVERGMDLGASFPAPRVALRDGATGRLFVTDASTEHVALVETNGSLVRTIALPGTAPVAAGPVAPGDPRRLRVLGTGGAKVRVFDLPDDAPAESPEAVAGALFAGVLADDLAAVEPLLSDALFDRLVEVLAEPSAKAELTAVLGAASAPEVSWKSADACRVFAETAPPDLVRIELSMTRHASTAKWVVVRW